MHHRRQCYDVTKELWRSQGPSRGLPTRRIASGSGAVQSPDAHNGKVCGYRPDAGPSAYEEFDLLWSTELPGFVCGLSKVGFGYAMQIRHVN
jgi:hypothetical protein